MVFVQNFCRLSQLKVLFTHDSPWEWCQPVKVVPSHAVTSICFIIKISWETRYTNFSIRLTSWYMQPASGNNDHTVSLIVSYIQSREGMVGHDSLHQEIWLTPTVSSCLTSNFLELEYLIERDGISIAVFTVKLKLVGYTRPQIIRVWQLSELQNYPSWQIIQVRELTESANNPSQQIIKKVQILKKLK